MWPPLFLRTLFPRTLLTLLRPFQFLCYALVGLVPRRTDTWAFGCWDGHRFGDNAGAVFLYLARNPVPGIRTAWITNERHICRELRADGHRCYTTWSPRGIWYALRAGVYIYDSLPKDINFWLSRGARLVHLRHGIGMKKIERAIDAPDHRLYKLFHGTTIQRVFWRILLPWHVPTPDLLMSCSPAHAEQGRTLFDVTPDRIRITGFARHDRLVPVVPQDPTAIPTRGRAVPTERPVFIYLPTFREGFSRQRFPWDALDEAARHAGVTIAVKLHFVDASRGVLDLDRATQADNLRVIDPRVDPAEVYPHADGMISDFSSAPFDFMLLDRPIIHFVPDREAFERTRPLMFTLEEIAVGPICHDSATLGEALRDSCDGVMDRYRERYDQIRGHFHTYPPGGAAARVVEAVLETFVHGRPDPARPHRYEYVTDADAVGLRQTLPSRPPPPSSGRERLDQS